MGMGMDIGIGIAMAGLCWRDIRCGGGISWDDAWAWGAAMGKGWFLGKERCIWLAASIGLSSSITLDVLPVADDETDRVLLGRQWKHLEQWIEVVDFGTLVIVLGGDWILTRPSLILMAVCVGLVVR